MRYPQVIVFLFFGVVMIILGIWLLLRAADADAKDMVRTGIGVYITGESLQARGAFLIVGGIASIVIGIIW